MSAMNQLGAKEIGRRLKLAREDANLRQADVAKGIGFSRPTLVSIEQGTRRLRINELHKLAGMYGISVNRILSRQAVHIDLVPRFRKSHDTDQSHVHMAVKTLNDLVKVDVELENILGIEHSPNYPPEQGINEGEVSHLGELHANELRSYLDIGSGPIPNVFSVIEHGLGIRLYQRHLSSQVSGVFAYEGQAGACILLNSKHHWARRVQSAAHELGHFMGTRQSPEILSKNENSRSREERYANAFGRAFISPKRSFKRSFQWITRGSAGLTKRDVILIAHEFGISGEAAVRRMEELKLVKPGTWKCFKNNDPIADKHAREILGPVLSPSDPARKDAMRPIPMRLARNAYRAWSRALASEGYLADLFEIDRVSFRGMLDDIALEECESNDLLKFHQ